MRKEQTRRRQLYLAVREGDIKRVDSILNDEKNKFVDQSNFSGITLLMTAISHHHTDIAESLINRGAQLNAQSLTGQTALMLAAEYDNEQILSQLLDNGAQVNTKDCHGGTALIIACRVGNEGVVDKLVLAGADVNASALGDYTPMRNAIEGSAWLCVASLVVGGVSCDRMGGEASSIFFLAPIQYHFMKEGVIERALADYFTLVDTKAAEIPRIISSYTAKFFEYIVVASPNNEEATQETSQKCSSCSLM